MHDDIRAKKVNYDLTSVSNMSSILDNGLLPSELSESQP